MGTDVDRWENEGGRLASAAGDGGDRPGGGRRVLPEPDHLVPAFRW